MPTVRFANSWNEPQNHESTASWQVIERIVLDVVTDEDSRDVLVKKGIHQRNGNRAHVTVELGAPTFGTYHIECEKKADGWYGTRMVSYLTR